MGPDGRLMRAMCPRFESQASLGPDGRETKLWWAFHQSGNTIPGWRSYSAAFGNSGDINLHQVRLLDSFPPKYFLIIALVSYFWEVVSPDFFCRDLGSWMREIIEKLFLVRGTKIGEDPLAILPKYNLITDLC
ncbi:hypothetical protein CDAR_117121 [Caerostris darwini]|uniref:Uncharacterized protein n=1 Tax=Caerostris darwini TaxID=1538125 RepID=A0AAV4WTV0_9ARAC|nr:hypothetical protein CDAR_117121 [Caerostris darwini]